VIKDILRLGIIGLGEIHWAHLGGYRRCGKRLEIVAVCDTNPKAAEDWAKEYGARAFQDYHKLLELDEVDAVDIMLPHSLHEEAVLAAIAAGKHVLVEKPLAPSRQAASFLVRQARRAGIVLAVAENTRFVKAYSVMSDLLTSGALGEPQFLRTMICGSEVRRLRDTSLWKGRKDGTVGGAILDAGVHSFYLLNWLIGEVQEVRAWASRRVPESQVEDVAVVTGRLAGGADFACEYVFTAEIPWNERMELYGSKGSVIVDQLTEPVLRYFRSSRDIKGGPVEGSPEIPYEPDRWKMSSIEDEVVDFVDSLLERRAPLVNLEHVVKAHGAVDAAYASLEKGGLPQQV
jgi:predicted dehydrogenase